MNTEMKEALKGINEMIGQNKIMVLATSNGDSVSARTVNVYCFENDFYFVTECSSNKYAQLQKNSAAALAVDAIQISGHTELMEHPAAPQNTAFREFVESSLPDQFTKYQEISEMRLVRLLPDTCSYISLADGRGFVIDYQKGQAFSIAHAM